MLGEIKYTQPFVGILSLRFPEIGYNFVFVYDPVCIFLRKKKGLYHPSDFLGLKKKEIGSLQPQKYIQYGSN
jgi:hypothetical protein